MADLTAERGERGKIWEIAIYRERMGAAGEDILFAIPAVRFGAEDGEGGEYREIYGHAYISDGATAFAPCAPIDNPFGIRWDEHRAWVQEDGTEIEWL